MANSQTSCCVYYARNVSPMWSTDQTQGDSHCFVVFLRYVTVIKFPSWYLWYFHPYCKPLHLSGIPSSLVWFFWVGGFKALFVSLIFGVKSPHPVSNLLLSCFYVSAKPYFEGVSIIIGVKSPLPVHLLASCFSMFFTFCIKIVF